jgi:hypothetical protein
MPCLPQLRLDQRLQLMSTSRSGASSVLEQQLSRPSSQRGRENGTANTELAPDSGDDELWSEWTSMREQLVRPLWKTDGFSSLPFLRR